jgi:hypothetical protein
VSILRPVVAANLQGSGEMSMTALMILERRQSELSAHSFISCRLAEISGHPQPQQTSICNFSHAMICSKARKAAR